MSVITKKDFHTPFNGTTLDKLSGVILRGISDQGAAASVIAANGQMTAFRPAAQDLVVNDAFFVASIQPAAGESIVVDVQMVPAGGGAAATILSGTLTYDSTNTKAPGEQIKLSFPKGKLIPKGAILTVVRTYTAGGGPAMGAGTANSVVIEAKPAKVAL